MSNRNLSLTGKLKSAVRRDPHKATVLGVLLIILGALVVRVLLPGAAMPVVSKASTVSRDARTEIVESAKQRARTLSAGDEFDRFLSTPVAPVTRNFFAVKLDYFPTDGTASRPNTQTSEKEKIADSIAKSLRAQADQQARKEVLIANLRQQALQLKLQSTVMGPTPRAAINGELLGEGDVIASFRILKIEARRIIVEREGIKLEITMK